MKILIPLLSLAFFGCSHVHMRVRTPDGTVVDYYSSKDVSVDLMKVGDAEVRNLRTEASGVIQAQGAIVGDLAESAMKAAPLLTP